MPTYRTDGRWGAGKGANLEAGEVDANFYELDQGIADLRDNPPTPINIAGFTVTGAVMTVIMSNGETVGPLLMPVLSWRWRDEWAPLTPYAQMDVFGVENVGIFLVLLAHTSAVTFDAAAVDGDNSPLYKELIGTAIPASGGTTGQILRKASDADNDTVWEDAPLPVAFSVVGAPDSNAVYSVVMTEAGVFAADFAGSYGPARVAATATATIAVNIAGSAIGSLTYEAASATPSIETIGGTPYSFAAGDVVDLTFPLLPDDTLADLAITLRAIRS